MQAMYIYDVNLSFKLSPTNLLELNCVYLRILYRYA